MAEFVHFRLGFSDRGRGFFLAEVLALAGVAGPIQTRSFYVGIIDLGGPPAVISFGCLSLGALFGGFPGVRVAAGLPVSFSYSVPCTEA